MSAKVTMTATWANGKPLATLAQAIEMRQKELRGETTERAVLATAITVMKSLRAETGVAGKNPTVIDSRYKVEITDSGYNPGWATPPRNHKRGRRVVRMGGSGAMDTSSNGNRIVNLAGAYRHVGEPAVKAYRLKISSTDSGKTWYDSICLALSKDEVFKHARNRIVRHVSQYRGVSKRLLGLAMHKMAGSADAGAAASMATPVNSKPLSNAKVSQMAKVTKQGNGYNSGRYSVSFLDDLPQSALALKHGLSGVDLALKKAANATIAKINRLADTSLDKKLKTPFPEVASKAS